MQTVTTIELAGPHEPGTPPDVFITIKRKLDGRYISVQFARPTGDVVRNAAFGNHTAELPLAVMIHAEMHATVPTQKDLDAILRYFRLLDD